MKSRLLIVISLFALLSMGLASCTLPGGIFVGQEPTCPTVEPPPPCAGSAQPQAATTPTECPVACAPCPPANCGAAPTGQPVLLTGEMAYTNGFYPETYAFEHAVMLLDMTGFVKRDQEYVIPVESQVLGYIKMDFANKKGDYSLDLPETPRGPLNDVDNNGKQDKGVQIFAVEYAPNWAGGPFYEGDDRYRGWPSYLASVKTDTENKQEVIGGKLVVWVPDDQQAFPTDYGPDNLLFTADDPVGPLPAGYSVIDLDTKPFTISNQPEESLALYEPQDVSVKDYTAMGWSEAFDTMFNKLRKEYAFSDLPGKAPDWDSLYAELSPRVKDAEAKQDATAYYLALRDYTFAFKDGHVSVDGGEAEQTVLSQTISGGYGFAMLEVNDGRFIVVYVLEGSPAAAAGMQVGTEVTTWNGESISTAIAKIQPISGPFSKDIAKRYQQVRYLTRVPVDTEAKVTFQNKGESPKTATKKAIAESASRAVTSIYRNLDPNALPVEFKILDSGIGYVKINSNYDDLNLANRLFLRALTTFSNNGLTAVIVDLRVNAGGAALGLAGYLYDQDILMGQLEYFSEKTGKFEPEGVRERVYPNEEQFKFDKMALLVGPACASACEIEAYGFSQVPGMQVIGFEPSAGIEAETARGDYNLPAGISITVPTGRFTLPDGSIFLEGKGVPLTVTVPFDEAAALSTEDVVLAAAEAELSK